MTPKELLYIEDALGRVEFIRTQCDDCTNTLQDASLKNFAMQLSQRNKEIFDKFYTTVSQ